MAHDFSKLKIPVNKVPFGQDIINEFKELQVHEEFARYPHADRNNVIRFVVYAYDPKSPFVENAASDLKKRKESAAEEAGFNRNEKTGRFEGKIVEIMAMENDSTNEMIFCYLRLINNRTWKLISTYEQVFSEYIKLLMTPISDSDIDSKKLLEAANVKAKLREECKIIATDLDSLYKTLFGDSEDIKEIITIKPIKPETI